MKTTLRRARRRNTPSRPLVRRGPSESSAVLLAALHMMYNPRLEPQRRASGINPHEYPVNSAVAKARSVTRLILDELRLLPSERSILFYYQSVLADLDFRCEYCERCPYYL